MSTQDPLRPGMTAEELIYNESASNREKIEFLVEERDKWKSAYYEEGDLRFKFQQLYEQALAELDQSQMDLNEARVAAQHIMELGIWQRVQRNLKRRWDWLEVEE